MPIILIPIILLIPFSAASVYYYHKYKEYKRKFYTQPVKIVERHIKPPVIYQQSFKYVGRDMLMERPYIHDLSGIKIIRDEEEKRYIIKDAVRKMADKMLEDGLIEIKDMEDIRCNRYEKILTLKLTAYKP